MASERLLEVIQDPTDEEYDEMMDWLGGSYDPEEFDVDAVNEALRDRGVNGALRTSDYIAGGPKV